MNPDDEYEQERQDNIRKNQELMMSLGLNPGSGLKRQRSHSSPLQSNSRAASRASRTKQQPTRTSARPRRPARPRAARGGQDLEDDSAGTRRSARIRAIPAETNGHKRTAVDDDYDAAEDGRAAFPRLKRLRNPLPPSAANGEEEERLGELDSARELDRQALPRRDANGNILFENNNRHFMPNVTPKEMLQGGIFGGTAFRPYFSQVLRQRLVPQDEIAEFPENWFEDLERESMLTSEEYQPEVNRFGVKAGQSLEDWEKAGWVRSQDPRGWWQWYFRFYLGRRTTDDARQIGRWLKACGPAGRFKRSLVSKIHNARATWNDETITPVVRQTLFHWAYALTERDFNAYL